MKTVTIAYGTRVRVIKVHEGDCYYGEKDFDKFMKEPATVVSHLPDDLQEDNESGTRGGCTLDFDKSMAEIFGFKDIILDDHCMVFADVELEVIQ
jgi:hypothetical protein